MYCKVECILNDSLSKSDKSIYISKQAKKSDNKSNSNHLHPIISLLRHLGTQTSTITTKSAAKNFCNTLNLHPFQRSVCNNFTDLIPSVADGIRISIEECQEQFQTRQWNCSIMAGAGSSIFGPMIRKGMLIYHLIHHFWNYNYG